MVMSALAVDVAMGQFLFGGLAYAGDLHIEMKGHTR
jgi:hypothetical protein